MVGYLVNLYVQGSLSLTELPNTNFHTYTGPLPARIGEVQLASEILGLSQLP